MRRESEQAEGSEDVKESGAGRRISILLAIGSQSTRTDRVFHRCFQIREQIGEKKKMPPAEQIDAEVKRHRLTIVPGLGKWDESTQMADESLQLREVPFLFSCFTNEITPRINLEDSGVGDTKHMYLQTIINCGTEVGDEMGDDNGRLERAATQAATQSAQLKTLRKMMRGIRYMVSADACSSKRALIMQQTLLATCDSKFEVDVQEFQVQVYP